MFRCTTSPDTHTPSHSLTQSHPPPPPYLQRLYARHHCRHAKAKRGGELLQWNHLVLLDMGNELRLHSCLLQHGLLDGGAAPLHRDVAPPLLVRGGVRRLALGTERGERGGLGW